MPAAVVKDDASLRRYMTAPVKSFWVLSRPIGGASHICSPSALLFSSRTVRVISESTKPGDMVLTRILCGASSTASALDSIRTAPLEAVYAAILYPGKATWDDCEAINTRLPPLPCLTICLATSWLMKKAPLTCSLLSGLFFALVRPDAPYHHVH